MNYKKMKNLFLRQSYLDSWTDYENSLQKSSAVKWDYLILTASNEEQAKTYEEQIDYRKKRGLLPEGTHYAVLPDPDGKRVGSGGATLHVLRYIAEQELARGNEKLFAGKRILVIHSGGDSRRVPQYSACGKLFSPVPRTLPNGLASTLFDEFVIGMSGVPARLPEGMLVLSGDVLLLFNPLQIDFYGSHAAAISMKENVETGKDHGVFLNDGNDYVGQFLHKQSTERLYELGVVNSHQDVDLDTGAVILGAPILEALYGLISTGGYSDPAKFAEFVNEEARISFYGDFLYPLAKASTLEQYYKEAAEGTLNEKLLSCRKKIWQALSGFSMKLLCLSPAEFIHFGTTRELMELVTERVEDYEYLNWKKQVLSTALEQMAYAAHNSYIGKEASIGRNAYLEDACVLGTATVGEGSLLSQVQIADMDVPAHTVLHGLKLKDGRFVVRIYGVEDNPKATLAQRGHFLGTDIAAFLEKNQLTAQMLWEAEQDIWQARLYPAADTMEEAVRLALLVKKMADGKADEKERAIWLAADRMSLCSSFHGADGLFAGSWQRELESRILAGSFVRQLESGCYHKDAALVFGVRGVTEDIFSLLLKEAEAVDFSLRIRIYYALSGCMKEKKLKLGGLEYDAVERMCFAAIERTIYENAAGKLPVLQEAHICREQADVALPVRVNWGGGWTDTPPYCNEKGGVVLNAALTLDGERPIWVQAVRLNELRMEFVSADVGACISVGTVEEIQDCHNPYDMFALHKAALIACGIVPLHQAGSLEEICRRLGGGIRLSTRVKGVPKGSGLGTSSILSAACVKVLFQLLGKEASDAEIYAIVLCMEQIMSTGGGWQDQVGGLTPGVKFITTRPGIDQKICVEQVALSKETKEELQERFALIYTGQRRLARNLLRDVVGGYLGGRPESIQALGQMQPLAALMRFALERGNVDEFAALLNRHWELSRQLDAGCTNTCIEQIFLACEDLIDGRFIAGAGGGGFLQVILRRGVDKQMLKERLYEIFQDSGVDVWPSEFVWE